jgi:hypothetical protein
MYTVSVDDGIHIQSLGGRITKGWVLLEYGNDSYGITCNILCFESKVDV